MRFVYPEFLYALLAVAIPIIIHLFNFRRVTKVYFSNVTFLKHLQQQTQSKAKLKHLLVLFSRILAIVFLVFAFTQPFIPSHRAEGLHGNGIVGIYVDNSFSMEANAAQGSLLDVAKKKALEVVDASRLDDAFMLISNGFVAGEHRLMRKDEVKDKIERLGISPVTRKLSEVYARGTTILNENSGQSKSWYFFSDFQVSTADFENLPSDTAFSSYMVPISSNQMANLYIDSCWFNVPTHHVGQEEELNIRIRNVSEKELEQVPLKLYIDKKLIVPTTFSVLANDVVVVTLKYVTHQEGIHQGKIVLRDSPITMDDTFYFSYSTTKNIAVTAIYEESLSKSITSLYNTDSVFSFSSYPVKQMDYSVIEQSNLVLLQGLSTINGALSAALKDFVQDGGSLVILPGEEIDFDSYQAFMLSLGTNYYTAMDTASSRVKELDLMHPLYQGVFESGPSSGLNLPQVNQHYKLSEETVSFKHALIHLSSGIPFLVDYKVGAGKVYISAVGITETFSNWTNHALFVPTFYNIALLSQPQYPLFYTIGEVRMITLNNSANNVLYHVKGDSLDLIPQQKKNQKNVTINIGQGIIKAGNYTLHGTSPVLGLAYNYHGDESNPTCFTEDQIKEYIISQGIRGEMASATNNTMSEVMEQLQRGKDYWKICVILALMFLALEVVLLKI